MAKTKTSKAKSVRSEIDEYEELRAPLDLKPISDEATESNAPDTNCAPDGMEPVYTRFQTHDECLDHIARTTWSYNTGQISPRQADTNIKAAAAAAKILGERSERASKTSEILRALARKQPAETARGDKPLEQISAQEAFDKLVDEVSE